MGDKSIHAGELVRSVVDRLALTRQKKRGNQPMNDAENGDKSVKKMVAYAVTDMKNRDKDVWTRVGIAFVNQKSIRVFLNAVPLNGKLVILESRTKPGEASAMETSPEAISQ